MVRRALRARGMLAPRLPRCRPAGLSGCAAEETTSLSLRMSVRQALRSSMRRATYVAANGVGRGAQNAALNVGQFKIRHVTSPQGFSKTASGSRRRRIAS